MYAHDFSRWGDVVTQCIEAHIRRVSGCYRFAILLRPGLHPFHSSGGLDDGVAISSKIVLLLVLLYLCSHTTLQTRQKKRNVLAAVAPCRCVRRVGDPPMVSLTPV